MKKISKLVVLTLLLSVTLIACGQRQFDRYKETFRELNRDPKSRKLHGSENDAGDLKGCEVVVKMSDWMIRKVGKNHEHKYYGRSQHWRKRTMNTETGVSLDFNPQQNSVFFINQKDIHPIYLGPWRPIILTHTEGSFLNSKKITEEKLIRFFAYQKKEGGPITYQYESQTEENKNIPEKKFSLSPTAKYAPDKFSLCVVKWTAKYGYNAVADLHKNPWFPFFSGQYLVGSGKIIDSETGEVIADEKGNLVKSNTGE